MANQLKMAMVDTIMRLLAQGWSYRRIAQELGVHRETVARLAGQSKPAKAPPGAEEGNGHSKPTKNSPGKERAGKEE
jgi:hypothetical protein